MKTQYVTDKKNKKIAIILPLKDYERLMHAMDELDCIKVYDQVKSRKTEFVLANDAFKQIEQKRK